MFLSHAVAIAALAVVAVQQILKTIPFSLTDLVNTYPVPSLIILSIIAAIVTDFETQGDVRPHGWTNWITFVATIAVVAAIVYRTTIANWTQLRNLESTAKPMQPPTPTPPAA
jgi:archaellum biogenesis protein FlaJ (TadC family)